MRFSASFLDEIRDRVSLSTVIGRRVTWDKRKTKPQARDYWAPCPFHSEKSPSFHVEDRKARYHCFGCGVTGDHFRFLMDKGGMTFVESVEEVAMMAGLAVPKSSPEAIKQEARRLTLIEVQDRARKFFQSHLRGDALAYIEGRRGITRASIERFQIGYAPADKNALQRHLAKEVSPETMIEAGLVIAGDDGRPPIDRFRNRIIFPVLDAKGRPIGFSGRSLDPEAPAKYLNSPETPTFRKGELLYNGPPARTAVIETGAPAIVVEGNIDVIIAVQNEFTGAVAPQGTALTEAQLTLLWRMSDEPLICFDGDAAGIKAASRALEKAIPAIGPGRTLRFSFLPPGLDPDSMIRKRGRDAFNVALAGAISVPDMLWRVATHGRSTDSPDEVGKISHGLRERIRGIGDVDLRKAYQADMDDRLAGLRRRRVPVRSNGYSLHSTSPGAIRLTYARAAAMTLRDSIIIAGIALAPDTAIDMAEIIPLCRLTDEAHKAACRMLDCIIDGRPVEDDELVQEASARLEAAGIANPDWAILLRETACQ